MKTWNDCPICGKELYVNMDNYLDCPTKRKGTTRTHYWAGLDARVLVELFALMDDGAQYLVARTFNQTEYSNTKYGITKPIFNYVLPYSVNILDSIKKLLLLA